MSGLQRARTEGQRGDQYQHPGLKFYNLSARWGHGIPQWPSAPGINVLTLQFHALDGVYVTEFEGIMHRGTHMDAPLHVTENTPSLTGYPLWRFFGTGVAVSIPKGKWGVITPDDLGKGDAENPQERHRHDQHRHASQACRQRRVLRLLARPL